MTLWATRLSLAFVLWGAPAGLAGGLYAQGTPSDRTTFGPPDAAQKARLLAGVQRYAERYVSNLPNFLCLEHLQQFEAGKTGRRWRNGDSLTFRLIFNAGREERSLQFVNRRPVRFGQAGWRTPLTTEGEFGLLIDRIFGSHSDAAFVWSHWDTARGRVVAVFDYSIDKEHSTLKLSLSDLAHAIVPYHGSVYADPTSGAIWRVTSSASEIPEELKTKRISTTIDYDEVPIGSRTYLLPVQASVSLATTRGHVRNEMQFTDYRKFETDSSITYSATDGSSNNSAAEKAQADPPSDR